MEERWERLDTADKKACGMGANGRSSRDHHQQTPDRQRGHARSHLNELVGYGISGQQLTIR